MPAIKRIAAAASRGVHALPSDMGEAIAHLLTADDDEAGWSFTVVLVPSDTGGNVRGVVNRIRTAVAKGIGKTADYVGTSVRSVDSTHTIAVYRRTDDEAAEVKALRDARNATVPVVTVVATDEAIEAATAEAIASVAEAIGDDSPEADEAIHAAKDEAATKPVKTKPVK